MTTSCYFCNEIERLQEHHIVPRRFDGSDDEENLVKLCPTCHDKIENLYNKRFYDTLGVEKPKEDDGSGLCQNSECYGDAIREISGPAGSYYVCEIHGDCDYSNCFESAATTRKNSPGTTLLCEKHSVCQNDECSSTNTVLVSKKDSHWERTRVYCKNHVPEDTSYANYEVMANDRR